ncbi:hypothetical protein [Salirhabdus sp. Marseille-P4669]|uniref:hypothetical protein n=1 Tax=Salirhabdus sp. Marseille-P4669 TaxID=2042310 RepID=UPI000C7A189D|nr:hypothetical protein [Salirhabdus sp. Marseille-P4669]
MDVEDKRISKLYRKILTSSEMIGLITYQKLDEDTQQKVKAKMIENGSDSARKVLMRLQYIQKE